MSSSSTLRDVLTWEQPFGPNATEQINADVFREILDNVNTAAISIKTSPYLIVGRRGSGKTSILSAIKLLGTFQVIAEIPSDKTFQKIVKIVDSKGAENTLPETVADAWEKLMWNILLCSLPAKYFKKYPKDGLIIQTYISNVGVARGWSAARVLRAILKIVLSKRIGSDSAVELLEELLDSDETFHAAQEAAIGIFRSEKVRAIILIDNIEQINLVNLNYSLAVSGLLMAIDRFKDASLGVEVRCCIPSEIFPRLTKIAANSDKSLSRKYVLHWKSAQLIHLAAIRWNEFVNLYAPRSVQDRVKGIDLRTVKGLNEFMHCFFPRTIVNGLGREEITLRYILRHTQLLPRQLIDYLNEIARASFKLNGSKDFFFTEDAIREGILNGEPMVCQGIFSGYKLIYPDAESICDVLLPQLGLHFRYGDFQRIFRESSGKVPFFDNEFDCLKVLVEIGSIGIVTKETDTTREADFAYNMPLQLSVKPDDMFVIHPAFSGRFRSRIPADDYKPVIPRGAEIT